MWGFIIQLMGLILFQVKHAISTDEPNPSIRKENNFRPFKGLSGNFTTLGTTGKSGPGALSSHYDGKDQDGQVTLDSGIQLWTVPQSAKYRIEAVGASGGYDTHSSSAVRGRGAKIIGDVDLIKEEIIKILVGQEGQTNTKSRSGGGGGGSFVVRGTDTPLIVAGGGGGVEALSSRQQGCDASASTSGNRGYDPTRTWPGGSDGQGATTSDTSYAGGGGGGLYSDGRSGTNFGGTGAVGGEGGKGFVNGGAGGRPIEHEAAGGFGGGGGGYGAGGGAGGGGGYSGGASGNNNYNACAGGGGSYNVGTDPTNECCFNGEGDGYVLIQQLECS